MPTETFFRLPEHKRQRIIEAVKEEIARSEVGELSISNVIRAAEISRGSFYQYFQNKEDLYNYLIQEYYDAISQEAIASLKRTGGDFFQMVIDCFWQAVRIIRYKESKSYRDHLLKCALLQDVRWLTDNPASEESSLMAEILKRTDRSRLKVETDAELFALYDICVSCMLRDMSFLVLESRDEDSIKVRMQRKLQLLRQHFETVQ